MQIANSLFSFLWSALAQSAEQSGGSPFLSTITTVVAFIVMLVILVFVHELGHFVVAVWMNIRVEEFGIGYPPRAATLFEHKGVKYTLNWLPLGGFVRFAGEDNVVYGTGSLSEARPWSKIPVMLAGPLMNLVLAMVIFAALFLFVGIATPTGKGQQINHVFENTPASAAGFQTGDILLTLNNESVVDNSVIERVGTGNLGKSVTALVERDGKTLTLTVVPGPWTSPEGTTFASGYGFQYNDDIAYVPASIPQALFASVLQTGDILLRMMQGFATLIGALFQINDVPAGGVAGPIGIARATGEIIDQGGMIGFWRWTAILSINLFVLNLLPIPALDGSHILFSLIEWVRGGKKIPPEKEALVHAIGFITLMGLMLLVSVGDVINAIRDVSVLGGG